MSLIVFIPVRNQEKVRRILVEHVNAQGEELPQREDHVGLARVIDDNAVG